MSSDGNNDSDTNNLQLVEVTNTLTHNTNAEKKEMSPEDHLCFRVLTSRKPVIRNMDFRVKLISDILKLQKEDYLDPSLHNDPCVKNWYRIYRSVNQRKKQWTVKIVASALCELDFILQKSLERNPMDICDFSPEIQYFKSFMEDVTSAALIAQKEESKKPRAKKLGTQKGGVRAQDNIDLTKLTIASFSNGLCASAHCRHQCLIKTGMDFQSTILMIISSYNIALN